MAGFVLDSSATVALVMPDERIAGAKSLKRELAHHGAAVPFNWRLEVANALLMAHRRNRISIDDVYGSLVDLHAFPIEVDLSGLDFAWSDTFGLAEHYRLTLYDAAYLELAIRLGLPLASLDLDLITAAKTEHVSLIETSA